MEFKRNRPQVSFTASELTRNVIEQVAKEIGSNKGRALDLIVYEWRTGKEMKPLFAPEAVDLEQLQNTLESLGERMRTIEKLMAWQVRKMTDED